MNDAVVRLLIIGVYLLCLVALGLVSARFGRATNRDYLLASHSIGPILLLLSIFGTTMTAFAMLGSTGEAFSRGIVIYGLMASASGILHSFCIYTVGVRLWNWGRRHGFTTQIQFLRARLDSVAFGYVLFPVLVLLIIPYLLIGVIGSGVAIETMTAGAFPGWSIFHHENPLLDGAVPRWLGSLVACVVVLTYVFFGGMRGTAWANGLQTLLFMALGVVTFIMVARGIGGDGSLWQSMINASRDAKSELMVRGSFSRLEFLSYLLIPLSLGMFPHLVQHWLTARSAAAFRLPIVCHPLFILIVWAPCVFMGVWASGLSLPASVSSDPNAVLPYLVQQYATPLAAGLLTAGLLAAIMSSLDSQFLCLGTMFTHDLFLPLVGEQRFSEKRQVWIARSFIVFIVAVTYVLSLQGFRSVFAMGIWSFTGFAGLFPVMMAALYWRRLTAAGALAGVLTMVGAWVFLFSQSEWGNNRKFAIEFWIGEHIERMNPVVVTVFATTLSMVVTSLLTRPPRAECLARFFPSATPASGTQAATSANSEG
ncbi:MAG TPA: sodium:solute symporter family protein [Pirellulaceae bacterium]|nr:sodium:solute symporter family protein [Pirellulaceae bacterium]